ncbi:hypothetical protein LJC27_07505 [Christensenellaceae bacterium OttesenSCG-928-M15]|nr:hypothetical protein [Christensenellaceae bacterium OttesenSCG-928-M15]
MKRISSLLLALAMVLMLFPAGAMAAGETFYAWKSDVGTLTEITSLGGDVPTQAEADAVLTGADGILIDGGTLTLDADWDMNTDDLDHLVLNNATLVVPNALTLRVQNIVTLGTGKVVVQKGGTLITMYSSNDPMIGAGGAVVFASSADAADMVTFTNFEYGSSALTSITSGTAGQLNQFSTDFNDYNFSLVFDGDIELSDLWLSNLTINSGKTTISNMSEVEVYGALTVVSGATLELDYGAIIVFDDDVNSVNGSFTNNGTINMTDEGALLLACATGSNTSTINVLDDAYLLVGYYDQDDGVDNAFTSFTNSGTINVGDASSSASGFIQVFDGATLTNTGLISLSMGPLASIGRIDNESTGTIDIVGSFAGVQLKGNANLTNLGTVSGSGMIIVDDAAIFDSSRGTFTFTGTQQGPTEQILLPGASGGISFSNTGMTYSAGGKWSNGDFVITSNGSYSDFMALYVDGALVDPAYYSATQGSTIVTVSAALMNSLTAGEHTFRLKFDHGNSYVKVTTSGTAVVTPGAVVVDPPKVGASLPALGLLFLALALCAIIARRKAKA